MPRRPWNSPEAGAKETGFSSQMEGGSRWQRGELFEPLEGLGGPGVRYAVEFEQRGEIALDEIEQSFEFALRGVKRLACEASGEFVESLGHWNPA